MQRVSKSKNKQKSNKIFNRRPKSPLSSYLDKRERGGHYEKAYLDFGSLGNPCTTRIIPDEDLNVIIQAIKSNVQVRAVNYDGVYCYQFTYGGKSVYVTCDTFMRARSAGISTATSGDVTNNLNNHNTDYTYTTMMKSYYYSWNGLDVYRWSFVRIGVRAHRAINNSIVYFTTEVQEAYKFSVATPFAIRYTSDVAQMGMGITGDTAGTATFSAALTWAAS